MPRFGQLGSLADIEHQCVLVGASKAEGLARCTAPHSVQLVITEARQVNFVTIWQHCREVSHVLVRALCVISKGFCFFFWLESMGHLLDLRLHGADLRSCTRWVLKMSAQAKAP